MVRWTTTLLTSMAIVTQAAMDQSTFATITGVISDPAGAAVPGAKIEATNRQTNYRYTATSNDGGQFT